jgi:heat shock protein HslJ
MKTKLIAILTGVLVLAACGQDGASQNPELLKGQNFATVQDGVEVTLSFDQNDMLVHGKVVNKYNAPYQAKGNSITFGPAAATMMMGPEKDMRVEQSYHSFMAAAQSYKLDKNQLTIKDSDGKEIVFQKVETAVK